MPEPVPDVDRTDAATPPGQPGDAASTRDDLALVARMAGGDESALSAFYDRWSPPVHALAMRIVRDETEAEEVVEAVFWQAWQLAARYSPERGAPGAWLLSMARSRSLDRLRTLRRRRDDAHVDDAIFETLPAPGDPLSDLSSSERAQRVTKTLTQLPTEQREVLELAYFEGLSQTEIAERLSVPLGTVKTRARLALRKMRDRLDALREVIR